MTDQFYLFQGRNRPPKKSGHECIFKPTEPQSLWALVELLRQQTDGRRPGTLPKTILCFAVSLTGGVINHMPNNFSSNNSGVIEHAGKYNKRNLYMLIIRRRSNFIVVSRQTCSYISLTAIVAA